MNIPSIPDKSYKLFIFIGLGLLIYSWNFNYQESKNYEDKRVAFNLELKKAEIKLNQVKKESSTISESIKNEKTLIGIYQKKLDSLGLKVNEYNNSTNPTSIKNYETEIKKDILEMEKFFDNQLTKKHTLEASEKLDSLNLKITKLDELKNLSTLKKYELENIELWLDEINKFTFILAIIGAITFLFGVFGWFKTESYEEEIQKRTNLHLPTYSDECQSCGVKFNSMNKFGTEKNGSNNYHFCSNCYELGEFSDPKITLLEIKEKVHEKLSQKHKSEKFIEKYLKKMDGLERWK